MFVTQDFAVASLGFVEGSSHVHWRKLATILSWWFLGFWSLLLATYALVAQGVSSVLLFFFLFPPPGLPLLLGWALSAS